MGILGFYSDTRKFPAPRVKVTVRHRSPSPAKGSGKHKRCSSAALLKDPASSTTAGGNLHSGLGHRHPSSALPSTHLGSRKCSPSRAPKNPFSLRYLHWAGIATRKRGHGLHRPGGTHKPGSYFRQENPHRPIMKLPERSPYTREWQQRTPRSCQHFQRPKNTQKIKSKEMHLSITLKLYIGILMGSRVF